MLDERFKGWSRDSTCISKMAILDPQAQENRNAGSVRPTSLLAFVKI